MPAADDEAVAPADALAAADPAVAAFSDGLLVDGEAIVMSPVSSSLYTDCGGVDGSDAGAALLLGDEKAITDWWWYDGVVGDRSV